MLFVTQTPHLYCYVQLVCILIVHKCGLQHIIIFYTLHSHFLLASQNLSVDLKENDQYVPSSSIRVYL